MEIKIVFGYLSGEATHVSDTLLMLKYGLQLIGHKVDFERHMQPGKINILLEGFTYDFIEAMKKVKQTPGTEFILIASELVFLKSFNTTLLNPADQEYKKKKHHWFKRYTTFKKALELSNAVLHLSQQQVKAYKDEFNFEKIFYLSHGYIDRMISVDHKKHEYKDIDVLFTGSVTPYRQKIISNLKTTSLKVVVAPASTPNFLRDDLVARSKLAINLKQNEGWKYSSPSRFYYHLINASLLLSEYCEIQSELDEYVELIDNVNFIQKCEKLVNSDYKQLAEKSRDLFKLNLPMKPRMEFIMDSIFSS